jgi:predicted RNase H-like nuclease (RuvC/YqgF family)
LSTCERWGEEKRGIEEATRDVEELKREIKELSRGIEGIKRGIEEIMRLANQDRNRERRYADDQCHDWRAVTILE